MSPPVGRNIPRNGGQQGGLASTIAPNQPHLAAGVYGKVRLVQQNTASHTQAKVGDDKQAQRNSRFFWNCSLHSVWYLPASADML